MSLYYSHTRGRSVEQYFTLYVQNEKWCVWQLLNELNMHGTYSDLLHVLDKQDLVQLWTEICVVFIYLFP